MQLFRTKKTEAGITFEMLQVLRCLWEEQGISQQVLAERIAKGKAALSNLIMNLEKKNYVYRLESPSDRRNKQVFLSEEGSLFYKRISIALFYKRISIALDAIYESAGVAIGLEKVESMSADLKLTGDVLEKV